MPRPLCLITGATAGIGRATAFAMARWGADVVVVARNRAKADEVKAELQRASPEASVELLIGDLAAQGDVRNVASSFLAQHAHLDILINNAGLFNNARSMTADGVETVFAV